MKKQNPFMIWILLVGIATMMVSFAIIYQLYNIQYKREQEKLEHLVHSQARLLEFSMRQKTNDFAKKNQTEFDENSENATELFNSELSQLIVNQLDSGEFGETGEYMVGSKVGDKIVFYLIGRLGELVVPTPVAWQSSLGEPMRRALQGQTGFLIAEDYNGVQVMASYCPIESLNIGLVAKVNLAEIRAPYILYGWIIAITAIVAITVGILIYRIYGHTMIKKLHLDAREYKKTDLDRKVEIKVLQDESYETKIQLQESEKKYQSIFDHSEDPMWLMRDGRIVEYNQAAMDVFNLENMSEMVNSHLAEISSEYQPDGQLSQIKADHMIAIAMKKGYFKFFWQHKKRGGEEFPSQVTLTRITMDASPAIHAMVRDISNEKINEENLEKALIDAERANVAKSEFLATMSHELRTPLNAIIGFSELLNEQYLGPLGSEKYGEYVHDIHDSGYHLLELINDILDISAIEANKRPKVSENCDLEEIIQSSLKFIAKAAKEKKISVNYNIEGDNVNIIADQRAIKQVIINLLSNSVKFTVEGGEIELSAILNDKTIEISVVDNGIGIEEDDISIILEPFAKIQKNPEITQEGNGLGLSICKKLIESYGGEFSIESELGIGTKASFILPVEYYSIDDDIKISALH